MTYSDLLGYKDRFDKIRIGQITSDIDEKGQVSVIWLDGEPGGQNEISLSYPCYDNSQAGPGWGVEYGLGKGMIGIFGFLKDNHAMVLGTLVSRVYNSNVGYDKTRRIQTGELRLTSKTGAMVYLDNLGGVYVSGATGNAGATGAIGSNVHISSNGQIDLIGISGASISITDKGIVNILANTANIVTEKGNCLAQLSTDGITMTGDTINLNQTNGNKVIVKENSIILGSGSETIILDGVVTKHCLCPFLGAPHPEASLTVLAEK